MFFPESENIVREHADLGAVVEQLDLALMAITSDAPLRPADFACILGGDSNQVESAFDLYEQHGVFQHEEMVECEVCHNLMSGIAFRHALEDEDEFECSVCQHRMSSRSATLKVFRMSGEALSLPRPSQSMEAPNAVAGDEPLGERAQFVLVAMLEIGAVDSDSRRSTEEIAAIATGGDANSLKNVISDLRTRLLIETRTGRSGGCWLTETGQARAAKIRQQGQNSATV
jgi:hypothetical protein